MEHTQSSCASIEQVKAAASQVMHLHYCENNIEGVISFFAPQFSWIGAGEEQYVVGHEEAAAFFRRFSGAIPKCNITEEHYDVLALSEDSYLCSGRMWITTDPSTQMYLKVHQRVSFVFQTIQGRLKCSHIHCSNPYMEMVEGELFPDKIGKQSYEYIQERLELLEEETKQKNRQLEVIMSSIPGGLKISRDDSSYSFAYVSRDAAALFGYTVEEFLEATGATAVGTVYPPDLPQALAACDAAFRDGGTQYSTKYRVRCKDGSLKWILDSGKKAPGENGETVINSLYLDITKSELDAQELKRQRELLQSIYDTVPCGILRFTRENGRFTLVSMNRAALQLLSYRDEESLRADWRNGTAGTVLEEDRPGLQNSYAQLRRVGDSADILYRVRTPNGQIRWLSGTNMIVSSINGLDVIQRMMFDVTDSRKLQEQLAWEQELYRVAMESSSDVLYEYRMDTDTLITYRPQTSAQEQQTVLREEFPQFSRTIRRQHTVHPDDIPAVIQNLCQGRAEIFEARFATPEVPRGEQYWWYRVTGKLISPPSGPSRVVGTFRNIHHEKMAFSENAEKLYMNQSALQAISEVYVCIYYGDLSSDTYYGVRLPQQDAAPSIPRRGSIQAELQRYINAFVGAEDRQRMLRFCSPGNLESLLTRVGARAEIEYRHQSSPETSIWLRLEIQLITMKGAQPQNAVFTFRNVTQERQQELEHRLEEQKAKQALEEAYEAANRANLAKSDFLSKMSHDIRTPMNAIMGMTAIAQKNASNQKRLTDCLQKIELSSRHLLNLINEVLDMSKIESGTIHLHEEIVDLNRLMQTIADMVHSDVQERRQELELSCRLSGPHQVYGDTVRLQQLLLNLLSNAVKYTPEQGHIRLELLEKPSNSHGIGCYEFTVQDDGIGMSEEFQQKLFRPFERAEDSRVSQIQGTGLGMAITQNLVRMMNGTIQVESQLNRGSRFTVCLYLKQAHRPEPERPYFAAPCPGNVKFSKHQRVLLVEDNSLNREITVDLLESAGLLVEEAQNGRQALELFQACTPGEYCLILMDIQMPVMDGYQCARAIRALDRPDAAAIPIIALTANAFADDVRRAKEAGMNEHLAKPLELDKLMQTLSHYIR